MKTSKQTVHLVDSMGSDLSVVNAARVSFAKESEWVVTPVGNEESWDVVASLSAQDQKLINYLAKHQHWSPFAHNSLTFRIKAPIFVARQLVKHQVGGVWNEVSRRYVDDEPEFYFPDEWRGRPEGGMKQGSSGVIDKIKWNLDAFSDRIHEGPIHENVKASLGDSLQLYNTLLKSGVAPEQARMVLPQNMMTEWWWTGSLMFFARVCKQRLDPHAQQETREVAQMIADAIPQEFEHSWKALMQ